MERKERGLFGFHSDIEDTEAHLIRRPFAPVDVFGFDLFSVGVGLVRLRVIPRTSNAQLVVHAKCSYFLETIRALPVEVPIFDVEEALFGAVFSLDKDVS